MIFIVKNVYVILNKKPVVTLVKIHFFISVEKPRYVRVNTLIMSVDDAIQEFKNDGYILLPKSPNYKSYLKSLESLDTFSFIQDYHIRELFAFKAGTAFYDHDGYNSGALVLQDKVIHNNIIIEANFFNKFNKSFHLIYLGELFASSFIEPTFWICGSRYVCCTWYENDSSSCYFK